MLKRGGDGRTALHAAVNPNRLEVSNLYLDAGANPWIKDKLGITPLDLAKKRRVPKDVIERMERMPRRQFSDRLKSNSGELRLSPWGLSV
ncbi:MAG TPA: hypothetical protein VF283_16130 [Bryobacteraceae bacterium]